MFTPSFECVIATNEETAAVEPPKQRVLNYEFSIMLA